jgi:transposase
MPLWRAANSKLPCPLSANSRRCPTPYPRGQLPHQLIDLALTNSVRHAPPPPNRSRAYSQDLRDRVIDAALGGLPARRAAAQFRIGLATAIRWVHRARQTGDRTAGRQGQPRRSKLDPHRDYILGLVETTPDMTISEMLDKLAAERDVYAARATLWIFLDRCGLTFKKRPRTRPSRTARTS